MPGIPHSTAVQTERLIMAHKNVVQLNGRIETARFSQDHALEVMRHVDTARAICSVLILAVSAVEDGSISYDDPAPSRWNSSIDVACAELHAVRSILTETPCAPNHDWWTPLNLLEMLGAATWYCIGPLEDAAELGSVEVLRFVGVVRDSLNRLWDECQADFSGKLGVSDLHPTQ